MFAGDIVEREYEDNENEIVLPPIVKDRKKEFKWKRKHQPPPSSKKTREEESIHQENLARLENMTHDEILREQQELLGSVNVEALKKMLSNSKKNTSSQVEDRHEDHHEPSPHIHFPTSPEQQEDLDPGDPDFFEKLHQKYFAHLPAEPEKMAWMQPVTDKEDELDYPVDAQSLLPAELRFGFNGELLGPKQARQISTRVGLHHHSDAPSAAGYTIPELAHLSRSTVPGQRCLGIRTLGRILFRAGDKNTKYGIEIGNAIWDMIRDLSVIQTLTHAADESQTKHLAVNSYAIEALWLWKQGGGHTVNESAL